MKKLFDKKRKNKGFSLVELIVVVAIMAVLMAVLVPTLVSNVEKSRQQKDKTAIAELRHAIVNALADEACLDATVTNTSKSAATNGEVTIAALFENATSDGNKAIIEKVSATVGDSKITLTSKYEKATLQLVKFEPTDGIVILQVTVADDTDNKLAFWIDSVGQHSGVYSGAAATTTASPS